MKKQKDGKPDEKQPVSSGRVGKHKAQAGASGVSRSSGGSRQGNIGHQDNEVSDNSHR